MCNFNFKIEVPLRETAVNEVEALKVYVLLNCFDGIARG